MKQPIVRRASIYERVTDGSGFKFNAEEEAMKIACCDCGLVHHHYIEIVDDKHVILSVEADNRATAQLRRHNQADLQQGSKRDKYRLVRVQ